MTQEVTRSNKFDLGVAVIYNNDLCEVLGILETKNGTYYDIAYGNDVVRVSEESLGISHSEVMKNVHLADSEEY